MADNHEATALDDDDDDEFPRETQVGDAIRMVQENEHASRLVVVNYGTRRLCLDRPSVERIVECIHQLPRVWCLALDCALDEPAAAALLQFLRATQQITAVNISGAHNRNFENTVDAAEGRLLQTVSRAVLENAAIDTLHFLSFDFGEEMARNWLTQLLHQTQTLGTLAFLQCHFAELKFLTQALVCQRPSLRDLSWNRCGLKDSQSATLIRAIQTQQIPLHRLEFCWCGMASESLRALIGYLKDPSPATRALQILDVNFNTNLFLNTSVKKEFLMAMKYHNHTLLELWHAEATISVFFDLGNPDEMTTQDFRQQVEQCLQRNRYLSKVQTSLQRPSSVDNMGLWANALGLLASQEPGRLASYHILNTLSTKFVEHLIPAPAVGPR